MAKAKEIEFIVKADGNVEIEARGYSGGACRLDSDPYEKVLGGKIASRRENRESVKSRSQIKAGGK